MKNNIAKKKFMIFLKKRMIAILDLLNLSLNDINDKTILRKEIRENQTYSSMIYEFGFMDRMIKLLNNFDNKNYRDVIVTDDYSDLSDCLLSSPLKRHEKFDILMSMIERNVDINVMVLDMQKLIDNGVDFDSILELVNDNKINKYLNNDQLDKITVQENEIINKIFSIAEVSNKELGQVLLDNYKILKEKYYNNIDNYNDEDIKLIIKALKNIGVLDELCDEIEVVLQTKYKKRIEKEKKNISISFTKNSKDSTKKYISDKEYKEIKKELKKRIDLFTMEPLCELSDDEIMYYANMLLKIGTEEGLVRTFFFRSGKKLDIKDNPIGSYNKIYDKLKFYEEKLLLTDEMDTINDYLVETFISKDEDYSFWKEQISSQLTSLVNKLPQNYEYEIKKAKTYNR